MLKSTLSSLLGILLAISFSPVPAAIGAEDESSSGIGRFADAQDMLSFLKKRASVMDSIIVFTTTGSLVGTDNVQHKVNLDPGKYHIYSITIKKKDDIDLNVYDSDGDLLCKNDKEDNQPKVDLVISLAEEVRIEIVPYRYESGMTTQYALVIAKEKSEEKEEPEKEKSEPRIHQKPKGVEITDETDLNYCKVVQGDYMAMIAHQDYQMIFDHINIVNVKKPATYPMTLGKGEYIIWGAGGLKINDLDIYVTDKEGNSIANDGTVDNLPFCEFTSSKSTRFNISVKAASMSEGYEEGYYLIIVVKK